MQPNKGSLYLDGHFVTRHSIVEGCTIGVYLPSFKGRYDQMMRKREEKAQMERTMEAVLNKDDGN